MKDYREITVFDMIHKPGLQFDTKEAYDAAVKAVLEERKTAIRETEMFKTYSSYSTEQLQTVRSDYLEKLDADMNLGTNESAEDMLEIIDLVMNDLNLSSVTKGR